MGPKSAGRQGSFGRAGLGGLLGARLLLAGASLALAVTVDRIEGGQGNPGIWGVYWTVAAAFAAAVVSGLMLPRTRNPERFATVQVAIDVVIVTMLVYFSGGSESVFTFLYALVVLYGALYLDRIGVGLSAGLAAVGYAFVVFGSRLGWLPTTGLEARPLPFPLLGAYVGFHAGALWMLGMLANTLAAELRRTGAALDRRTVDLERLRDLHLRTVESIGSGILTIDGSERITSFNPEAERITGIAAKDALGRRLEELIPGARAIVWDGERDENPFLSRSTRDRIAHRNERGDALFLGMAASPLRDETGEGPGHVVIFQDVTRIVSMEAELRRSERLAAVGEMAARIAHEIRNPLASISGSVQILQSSPEREQGSPEHGKLMEIMVREVDRLNDLIGDFLLYSRPANPQLECVALAPLVEEVAKISESNADRSVRTELDLDADIHVMADPSLFKGVVWNLWNNALEAAGGNGRVRVRVAREEGVPAQAEGPTDRKVRMERRPDGQMGRTVVLEVEDSGPGITPDVRERIFEPFFTTKREGTGLGLATVQRIVEQHGGAIEVSNGPLGGARFRILLNEVESGG
jgi:two-component system sensor histidine kinase PilS (NtrC family)